MINTPPKDDGSNNIAIQRRIKKAHSSWEKMREGLENDDSICVLACKLVRAGADEKSLEAYLVQVKGGDKSFKKVEEADFLSWVAKGKKCAKASLAFDCLRHCAPCEWNKRNDKK